MQTEQNPFESIGDAVCTKESCVNNRRLHPLPTLLLLCLGVSSAAAQPTRIVDGQLQVLLPTRIVITRTPDNSPASDTVEAAWHNVPAGSSAVSMRLADVPIFTVRPNGQEVAGVEIANDTAESVDHLISHLPVFVQLLGGRYFAVSDDHTMLSSGGAAIRPHWSHVWSAPKRVCICYEQPCLPAEISAAQSPSQSVDTSPELFAFLDAWFTETGQRSPNLTTDVNSDGIVTEDDLLVFLDTWLAESGAYRT